MRPKAILVYDPKRLGTRDTMVKVKAHKRTSVNRYNEELDTVDISALEEISLRNWLTTCGDNPLAENIVGVLLGHGRLHALINDQDTKFPWNVNGPIRDAMLEFVQVMMVFGAAHKDKDLTLSNMDFQFVLGWLKAGVDVTPTMLKKASYGSPSN